MIKPTCARCHAPMSRRELLWEWLICRQCDEQLLQQPALPADCPDTLSRSPGPRLPGPVAPQ
jgi:hypothetical protein